MSVTGILLEHPEVCYLSKCQYIISTLYQKLYVWHSYPPPTRPCLQQIKLKDRKVIFPYLVCILVDLVPEQIVLSTREGKERQGPAPSQRSWCSAGAGTEPVGACPRPGEGGKRSLGCFTHPAQSRQQRWGASSALRGAAKSTARVKERPECLHCPGNAAQGTDKEGLHVGVGSSSLDNKLNLILTSPNRLSEVSYLPVHGLH